MPKRDKDQETLRQALDYSWPEVQKAAIEQSRKEHKYQVDDEGREYYIDERGQKVHVVSFDSWWLDRFDRKDVIFELPGVVVMNTADWHVDAASYTLREAYGVRPYEDCDDCFTDQDLLAHIERFPEGQFVAIRISGMGAGHAVAMAVTMRTSRAPTETILPWREAIGDMRLSAHEADGDWLYGVEMAVRPMYRRHGIGTSLYEARMRLVGLLNLRGWYMVGMLMGYRRLAVDALQGEQKAAVDDLLAIVRDRKSDRDEREAAREKLKDFPTYADLMDIVEYGNRVIAGEINDPTVTMQMNRGFRAERVITDYVDEPAAGDAGVLLVWDNPHYDPEFAK